MNVVTLIFFLMLPIAGMSYIGWHLWVLLPLDTAWKTLIVASGVLSFLLLLWDVTGGLDVLPLPFARVLYNIGTSSVIVLLYLLMIFLVLDLGRLLHLVPRLLLYGNGGLALGLLALMFGILLYGNIRYRHKVRVPLELKSEKPLSQVYRIVMASDLHLGYHNDRRELARWVDMMNREQPDLILIAGDIIDVSVRPLLEEDMAAEFRRLQAPVYACLGNHEYYAGTRGGRGTSHPYTSIDFYRDAGIHLLIDEVAEVDSTLVIIGRDDRMNPRRKPLASLLASHPSDITSQYTILLDHQPHNLDEAEHADIDFQLSGHTHRGQVWPISWITDMMYECSWGSHRRGRTQYYISSGLGIWGGRYRIGSQSEYIVATLH